MELIDKSNEKILKEYESFAAEHGFYTQSLCWVEVKSNWGWDAVISRDSDGKIRACCLVLIRRIPVFKYSLLYAPHGPVCGLQSEEVFLDIFEGIKQLAKKYNAYEFMFDPLVIEEEIPEFVKAAGFSHEENAPRNATIQVRENYIIKDLKGKSEEEIFALFRTKYRTQIRKAIKKEVYCKACGTEALDDFYELMVMTGKRDGITIRSKEYYAKVINTYGPEQCRLFMCYVDEDGQHIPLSGAIALRYGGRTVYAYSGSADHHRTHYPNYLIQWVMMQWALAGGCDIYDFGGIPYYWDKDNPASGVYQFKKGFNGEIITYAGEFSYIFKPFATKLLSVGRRVYTWATKKFGTKH